MAPPHKLRRIVFLFASLGLILLLGPVSAHSSPPLADWKTIVNASESYALQAPPQAEVKLYSPENILHIELPGPQVLTIQRRPNPETLSSEAWTEQNIANPAMKGFNELAPAVPISEREPISISGMPAVSFTIFGPVRSYRRSVLAAGDQVYLIDHPTGEGQQEGLFKQIVSTFEIGNFPSNEGFATIESLASEDIPTLSVPYYSQRDPAWICDQIGTCWCYLGTCYGYTGIGDAGCYIASEAMVFDYFTGGPFMNPQELDTCLTQNGGYTYWEGCGWGLCATSYQPLEACAPNYVAYKSFSSNRALLDEDLRNGFPVIAWVDGGAHYLVITGKRNGLYQVNDPLYPRTEIYSGQIIHFVRFQGPLNHGSPSSESLEAGFPVQAFQTTEPVVGVPFLHTLVANLDIDPDLEIAVSALDSGPLYAWNADSSLAKSGLTGFQYGTAFPAAGRIAHDSAGLSLVTGYNNGKLLASNETGAPMPGWPHDLPLENGPPSLADVDQDGLEEIFAPASDGQLYGFNPNGSILPGWPLPSPNGAPFSSPAIADLDGDQDLEIVAATIPQSGSISLHAFHHNGTPVTGFPIQFPGSYPTVPVIGDIDGDSGLEIMVVGAPNTLRVYDQGGVLERTLEAQGSLSYPTALALADLDGDHIPEILLQADRSLNVWHGDGSILPGWPENWSSDFHPGFSSPVVGDVDGDLSPDILITLQSTDPSLPDQVRVFGRDAEIMAGFPKELPVGAGSIPAIADIDLDGRNEIIITGSGPGTTTGFQDKVWVFDLGGEAHGPVEWGQFGGGPGHRGVYPPPPPPAPQFPPLEAENFAYLPLVDTEITQLPGRIFGQVIYEGHGLGGVPVSLFFFDGQSWQEVISLASDALGEYRFVGLHSLVPGEKYIVRYTNPGNAPQMVDSWNSREITTFPSNAHIAISPFDLKNLSLTAPSPDATVPLPALFQWQPRGGGASDFFSFVLFDPQDMDPFYQSEPFRGDQAFSLTALPARFKYNKTYNWSVWIHGPDGALAIPNEARPVIFTSP